jgi:CheY-like chemotaxis protein
MRKGEALYARRVYVPYADFVGNTQMAQAAKLVSKTILVVDDSAMICHVVAQILRESGYTVLTAKNGQEGYELAQKHIPQLVIMDVEMPVMDGIQATALIKSKPETKHIPVMIFTSLGGENDLKRAREAGCQGFLNKPISRDAIQSEIKKILGNPR